MRLLVLLATCLLIHSGLRAQCTGPLTGQTALPGTAWVDAVVPDHRTATVTTTTTAGSIVATVPTTTGLELGGPIEGPNVALGTTVAAFVNTMTIQLSTPAIATGTAAHAYRLSPYASDVPPTTPGTPTNTTCSICPSVFTAPICAGEYTSAYFCSSNVYEVTLCGSALAFNSTITITTMSGAEVLAFDDDGCGTVDGPSTVMFVPEQPGLYRIRVFRDPCTVDATACGTLEISCSMLPPPPANDEPCGATALSIGTSCSPTFATTAWATPSTAPVPTCGAYIGTDVWFSAVVPTSGRLAIGTELGTAANLSMAAYSATSCTGPLTQIACNADHAPGTLEPFLGLEGLTPGSTVHIRIWPPGGAGVGGTFGICAYDPVPPVNDLPCGAIELPVTIGCTSQTFSTASATIGTPGLDLTPTEPTCGTPVAGGDVWFRVTMPVNGSLSLITEAEYLTDMVMAIYQVTSGTACGPGTLAQLYCADNGSNGTMPSIALSGEPGAEYLVRLWNRTPAFGTFSICAVENVPPVNNDPCGAIALTVQHGCLFPPAFSNLFATNTGSSAPGVPNVPAPACGWAMSGDVWFTAVVPPSGSLVFDTDHGSLTNAALSVYTATGSCAGEDLELTAVSCAIGGSQNSVAMPYAAVDLAPGTLVYIRVWREGGGVNGTFHLCASDPVSPSGCVFHLSLYDAANDGWDGGSVTVCVDDVCTDHTLHASSGTITFGATPGSTVTLAYTPGSGNEHESMYQLRAANGGVLYASGVAPAAGESFNFVVDEACNLPPLGPSDCAGSIPVVSEDTLVVINFSLGAVADLDASNRGCLVANERVGVWLRFTTIAAGDMVFTIGTEHTDLDFGLWGPYSEVPCPPSGPPIRCSFSAISGPTGLSLTSTDLTEGAMGDGLVRYVDVLPGETYLLYVSDYGMVGGAFELSLNWDNGPQMLIGQLPTAVEAGDATQGMITVHPNPVADLLRIPVPGPTSLRILATDGRLVAQRTTSDGVIDARDLAPGTYILHMIDGEGSVRYGRFVKE